MPEYADAIIIGAGHNGLVAAGRLARAGWSVLVMEAASTVGGYASTSEPVLPGFRHSGHANALMFVDLMPELIAPAGLSLKTVYPDAQFGMAFADGRPPIILYRHDLPQRTRRCFGVYSSRDASTYTALKQRSEKLSPLLRQGLYECPDSVWFHRQASELRRLFSSHCNAQTLGKSTARTLIDALFEAPEVRMLLYLLAVETGVALDDVGSDLAFLGYSLWIAGRWRVPVGGMQSYSDALYAAAIRKGVNVRLAESVDSIVVHQGRAVGVDSAKGERILASKAVLAAVPVLDTFDKLLGNEHVSQDELEELRAFRRNQPPSIASSVYCLNEPPNYKSARHNPDINSCLKTAIGHEAPEDVVTQQDDIAAGLLPKPAGIVRMHSLWDKSLAPDGYHVAGVDTAFPAVSHLREETWGQIEASFPNAFRAVWAERCINSEVQCLAGRSNLADRFERRMLLRMGDRQYQTSISSLYLSGPGMYPGGGVHGACGLNAAHTALRDAGEDVTL